MRGYDMISKVKNVASVYYNSTGYRVMINYVEVYRAGNNLYESSWDGNPGHDARRCLTLRSLYEFACSTALEIAEECDAVFLGIKYYLGAHKL